MHDLVKWLGEQLDEDERMALASKAEPWNFYADGQYGAVGEFLATWNPTDPARVLGEVDAKLC